MTATNWIPGMFRAGIMARDRRFIRCGDLTGRAPSGNGSCVIYLAGPRAGWGYDFATGEGAGPIDLIAYATGLSGKELFDEAARIAGTGPIERPKWQRTPNDTAAEHDRTLREVERILAGCSSLAGSLAIRYLEGRGLRAPDCPDLLYHSDLTDRDTNRGYNGLVAIVRDEKGERTGGILRIFLTDDGAAKAPPGKKMLGPVAGGAVQLAPIGADGHLGVAEGVETSLAVMRIFGVPCWATLSTSGMKRWNPPANARRVTIFADAGEPGADAASNLTKRLGEIGIDVEICEPRHGDDFNDDLQRGAVAADYAEQSSGIIRIEPAGSPMPITRWGTDYEDFWTYLPMHKFLYVPTREMWPGASVDAQLPWKKIGDKQVKPSSWLSSHRAVEQMTWQPGSPEIIEGFVIQEGEWIAAPGRKVFNQYRAPDLVKGDPAQAGPWQDHIQAVYPEEAGHIIKWFAHRVQRPGEKINHALVLGGSPGVGKDTMIEPVKYAVGGWNFAEISPKQLLVHRRIHSLHFEASPKANECVKRCTSNLLILVQFTTQTLDLRACRECESSVCVTALGRFNGFVKSIILRISEARDLGDDDRYAFYDATKVYMAAPPNVIRCDEKHLREYAVANVCGVIITTNYKTGGLYLPPDDRRHFVAWSDRVKEDFSDDYWARLWRWYDNGGRAHVAALLAELDISSFNAKALPPKTPTFWEIVYADQAPECSDIMDAIERMGSPSALTLDELRAIALGSFAEWLNDRRNQRAITHRLEEAGYVVVRNPNQKQKGYWRVNGRRQPIYASVDLSPQDRIKAARALVAAKDD
jgi:hypothetical protein